jgi:hypothetical protein
VTGLRLVKHRMPPSWDGRAVTWDPFVAASPMFICPPPPMYACEQCGSIEPRLVTTGLVGPAPGATFESVRVRTGRRGRPISVSATVPAWATRDLTASRCPDCLHTSVYDLRTDEHWDLGPEDYTDAGSVAPVVKRWTGGLFDLLDEDS